MKKIKKAVSVLSIIIGLITNYSYGQKTEKMIKLKTVEYEVVVNVTPQQAWDVLAKYGNIGSFHSGLLSSKPLNGSGNEAVLGCDRECIIPNGRKNILVREKIVEIIEGQYYTYDVYEWENFPLTKMINTFGVKNNTQGQTVIYQKTEFRLKPGFLTGIMKGKLRRGARESLIAYKHYMETGEEKADIKILKKKYKGA